MILTAMIQESCTSAETFFNFAARLQAPMILEVTALRTLIRHKTIHKVDRRPALSIRLWDVVSTCGLTDCAGESPDMEIFQSPLEVW